MEFGSAFVLSKSIDPAIDVEEIDGNDHPADSESSSKTGENVNAEGGNFCLLDIYDTGGEESVRDQRIRTASAFLIVFSVTDENSFENAKEMYEVCCKVSGRNSVTAVLCANKCDLLWELQVSTADALSWAYSHRITMFNTSARLRNNIDEAFIKLVQDSPRNGDHEYKIVVLGSDGVGKTSITKQFAHNVCDLTVENLYHRQILVPGLPPLPQQDQSWTRARSSRFLPYLSFFSSSSRKPANSTKLPTYAEATSGMTSSGSGAVSNVRRIPKVDTNIIILNLGSLAPKNLQRLGVNALQHAPPACSSCSAIMDTSPTCVICGTYSWEVKPERLKVRQAIEEYTLSEGSKFPPLRNIETIVSTIGDMADEGLVVFCIDTSGSMSSTQQTQGSSATPFNRATEPPERVSWVERVKEVMQKHLDHLEMHFPRRKVAIITFADEVRCFIDGTQMAPIDTDFTCINDAMDSAGNVWSTKHKTVSESAQMLHEYIKSLIVTEGKTALGAAVGVALGLAREHRRETGTGTEIFLWTDGTSNTGIGYTASALHQSFEPEIHGKAFYAQAGDIALSQSTKINILGIEGEFVALDVLLVAARASGGVVRTIKPEEFSPVSQRHAIAKNVTVRLYAPEGWIFSGDRRPGVIVDNNTLTYALPQVFDDVAVGFSFSRSDGRGAEREDTQHFQAQITYTSPDTGATNLRILNRVMPVTTDRAKAEAAVDIALVGAYTLQRTAFAAYRVVSTYGSCTADFRSDIKQMRDNLRATHNLLLRGAKTAMQQQKLAEFAQEGKRLDKELEEIMMKGWPQIDRARMIRSIIKVTDSSRNAAFAGSMSDRQVEKAFLK